MVVESEVAAPAAVGAGTSTRIFGGVLLSGLVGQKARDAMVAVLWGKTLCLPGVEPEEEEE